MTDEHTPKHEQPFDPVEFYKSIQAALDVTLLASRRAENMVADLYRTLDKLPKPEDTFRSIQLMNERFARLGVFDPEKTFRAAQLASDIVQKRTTAQARAVVIAADAVDLHPKPESAVEVPAPAADGDLVTRDELYEMYDLFARCLIDLPAQMRTPQLVAYLALVLQGLGILVQLMTAK